MSVYNPSGKVIKTASVQRCDGCGVVMPSGSMVLRWSVWRDGEKTRLRLCSGCQEVVYGCKERRPLDIWGDEFIVRDVCESCDGYLNCERVKYLKEKQPGEVDFKDLPLDS